MSARRKRKACSPESGARLLAAAAAACPHGLMLEEGGRVVYANPAYACLVGVSPAARVYGKQVSKLPPPGSVPVAPCSRPRNNNGHDSVPPDYDTAYSRFRMGKRLLGISVVRDVSERRRLEKELRDAHKMEALGRLVGGVAHDFNNLLTAITLFSGLLVESLRDENSLRRAREIHAAAERGATLVRQLLAFARQHPLAPCVVSLNHVVTGMRDLLERLVGEHIRLHLDLPEQLNSVRVDPSQIEQALLNLVMNARDAMPEGGELKIATSNRHLTARSARRYGLHAGNYVMLSVADTGCGMDEHIRARLFEPFFTTKAVGKGTGLGLAMVYGFVSQSGGAVSVSSEPGRGTRVIILLPRCTAPPSMLEWQPQLAGALAACRENVMLVEDDAAVRHSIAQLLSTAGYKVTEAADGDAALTAAAQSPSPFHLLLSDVVMPGRCGCDVARALRDIYPDLRVLFITGYPAAVRAAAEQTTLLYKPFTPGTLLAKVRQVLDAPAALAATALT